MHETMDIYSSNGKPTKKTVKNKRRRKFTEELEYRVGNCCYKTGT
jgi:hypothetical protein